MLLGFTGSQMVNLSLKSALVQSEMPQLPAVLRAQTVLSSVAAVCNMGPWSSGQEQPVSGFWQKSGRVRMGAQMCHGSWVVNLFVVHTFIARLFGPIWSSLRRCADLQVPLGPSERSYQGPSCFFPNFRYLDHFWVEPFSVCVFEGDSPSD